MDPEIDSPVCNLCEEEEMTSAHIMGACPALHRERQAAMGAFFMDPPFDAPIGSVLKFMRECGLAPLRWD